MVLQVRSKSGGVLHSLQTGALTHRNASAVARHHHKIIAQKEFMSPSRFELETLSVLDSRDNRLHHGDSGEHNIGLFLVHI